MLEELDTRNERRGLNEALSVFERASLTSENFGIRDYYPDDEYNFYVGGIYRLLASAAEEYKITQHLRRLETTSMSLPARDREELKTVKMLADVEVEANKK